MNKNIARLNPWWDPGGEKDDPDIKRAALEPIHYDPKPISPEDLRWRNVYTLRGPRRSGKTVALKKLIASSIAGGIPAKKFIWLTAEAITTLDRLEKELRAAVDTVANGLRGPNPIPPTILVDEITAVDAWQRVIKKLRDDGTLTPFCVILTGSSAADIRRGAERMAGRRRDVEFQENKAPLDRHLLAMDFAEFLRQIQGLEIKTEDAAGHYLACGGYPHRVGIFVSKAQKEEPFEWRDGLDDIFQAASGEFERRGLNRAVGMEIISRLAELGCQATSWESFAKPIEGASRETVKSYLRLMGESFLLATVHSFDASKFKVARKKDRKLVWLDPSLAHLAAYAGIGKLPSVDTLSEQAVGAHLVRWMEPDLAEGAAINQRTFTWKSAKGKEIDYLVVPGYQRKPFPVEVKYQTTISDWDFQSMERAFGKGILVTKDTAKDRLKSRAVPLHDFLKSCPVPSDDI